MLALEVALDLAGLEAAQAQVDAFLEQERASDRARYKVRLVLDELVANLMAHGRFAGDPPALRIDVRAAPAGVLLGIEDAAEPFDPRATPAPSAPPSLHDDRVGGLGLALVRKMVEIRDYRRLSGGWNRTEIVVAGD